MKSPPTMDPEALPPPPGTPPDDERVLKCADFFWSGFVWLCCVPQEEKRGGRKGVPWRMTLSLAYQSLGVVYGDLSTSPLYVYKAAFAEDIQHTESNEEILGVLSFVFWTLTLVPLLKYVCIVLRADDHGEGGTFALYSLLCRHARAALLPPGRASSAGDDDQLFDAAGGGAKKAGAENGNAMTLGGRGGGAAASVRRLLEKHKVLQRVLLVLALVGTCMVIGDGVLTPAISVFSAVSGLELSMEKEHHKCSEAMFADLGHFNQLSIQIAFTCMVYPALILAYMGQAAYLCRHHTMESEYKIGFYVSVPEKIRWPVMAIAILAAVVGSQAVITGLAVITVMLVTTCLMSLVIVLCWHRSIFLAIGFIVFFGTIEALYFSAALIKFREGAWVPIVLAFIFMLIMCIWHYGTIKKYEFDVQSKVSINWLLGLSPNLGIVRVRGIGLIHTELETGIPAIFSHFVTNLPAFHQVLIFMCIKNVPIPHVRPEERFLVGRIGPKEYRIYRCIVRYGYHDFHKDDMEFEKELVCSIAEFIRSGSSKLNGMSDDFDKDEEQRMSVVRSGSIRMLEEEGSVENTVGSSHGREIQSPSPSPASAPAPAPAPAAGVKKRVRFVLPAASPKPNAGVQEELQELSDAREAGMAFILGHSHVKAKSGSSFLRRFVINFCYDFLRRNSRGPNYAVTIPHASTLEVGMMYYV
nr:unnamed protein product [Digitaria exilis]